MAEKPIKGEIVPAGQFRAPLVVPQHVLDDFLSPGARKMIVRGVPESTLKTYAWQWHLFRLWCEDNNRTYAPASENTLIEYLHTWESRPIHLRCHVPRCGHRPAPPSAWIWYSAVRFYHGVGEPPLPWEAGKRLALAMKAYGEDMADAGWRPQKAPRAYDSDVTRMVDACDLDNPKHLRDRALILLNFYTAARASDLATYRLGDIRRMPNGMEFSLARSKANKSGGRKIETRRMRYNTAHPAYCGPTAMTAWVKWLAGQGVTQGAIFRPFDKHGNLVRGEQDKMSFRMRAVNITRGVTQAALRAGLDNAERYTSHSLRRGRATQQRELGVDPIEIARAYGWAPGGKSLLEYLEEAEGWAPTAPGAVGFL